MKIAPQIDLGRSLNQVFGTITTTTGQQIEEARDRQTATARTILKRFFHKQDSKRRELVILADEVGLGKTYVALAVAVSILDAIRRGEAPEGLPANRPAVLVLTPNNDALFNKWKREAESFRQDCANPEGSLGWLQIRSPLKDSTRSGNIIDLALVMREATRHKPMLMIAKQSVFGAALNDRDSWRRRALAVAFEKFRIKPDDRRSWCRNVLGSASEANAGELLDLRKAHPLWDETDEFSPDLAWSYERALRDQTMYQRFENNLANSDYSGLIDALDDLSRLALAGDFPMLPLVVIDEIHNLKNRHVQARRNLLQYLGGHVSRFLGLSATPFQLRHDELLSVLEMRDILSLTSERATLLREAADELEKAMAIARDGGDSFRRRWLLLRTGDGENVAECWRKVSQLPTQDRNQFVEQIRPRRVANAIADALGLQERNRDLRHHLRSFVIRHQRQRSYREHFVGAYVTNKGQRGDRHFAWAPGLEVCGDSELIHYLMMRAVTLATEEKGLPGLGAELTGSYRHLVETSAVWKRLKQSQNPTLRTYQTILDGAIGQRCEKSDPDEEHKKIAATVGRAMEFFRRGQKTVIFCVFTKTAEALRDCLQQATDEYLHEQRDRIFHDSNRFENFRRRFFNRREPLFSLIQDHPLLGYLGAGIPPRIRLGYRDLERVARILLDYGEYPSDEKTDRRLLLAAAEHVAVNKWRQSKDGMEWIETVLRSMPELEERIASQEWLDGREPLSRARRAGRKGDPEARRSQEDPLDVEAIDSEIRASRERSASEKDVRDWIGRLQADTIGQVIGCYVQPELIGPANFSVPLLPQHHGHLLRQFDLQTRTTAGQVFRRILMAEEFLLRYLTDVERETTQHWADYIAKRYVENSKDHLESLRDRVNTYFETLVRAKKNPALLNGYYDAAENRNVIQLVQGGTPNRDRYFLGFNTPYRPDVLVSTSVGQEGIDLHRECRHVIHHDLCWNPATIEQRTGRVDRIGGKVERERIATHVEGPALEIAVPYLAATYDERMFEELYRRAQLFEVTMGGDMRVEGKIEQDNVAAERRQREKQGIGTEDEDLGSQPEEAIAVDLPIEMVDALRIDLSVWKPRAEPQRYAAAKATSDDVSATADNLSETALT